MKTGRLLAHTAVVSAGTGVSRLLGFLREILMARLFGTSLAASAFVVAFTIPNLFRQLFGEGALSAAFVPVFTESVEREGRERAWGLAARIFSLLALTLVCIAAIGIFAVSGALAWLPLGPRAALTLPLLRIMLPYLVFICLVALSMAILNSLHHFAVPAATPLILNLVWIVALLAVCPWVGGTPEERVVVVAWAILLAGVLQLLAQTPVLWRYGWRPRLRLDWHDPRVRRVLLLMGPVTLGLGVHQVNVLVDRLLAMLAAPWAPAALNYAERLIYLPLGVIATALGTVLLPVFASQAARERRDHMLATLHDAMRNLLLVMTPAAMGLLFFARPIVDLAYRWPDGEFDASSALQTARALRCYAPGLLVFGLYKMLVPVFYALQDTRTPVRIGLRAVGLNFMLNVAFVLTWPADFKHAGLAVATVLSSAYSVFALARGIQARLGSPGWRSVVSAGWRCLVLAVCVCGGGLLLCHTVAARWGGVGVSAPKSIEAVVVLGSIGATALAYLVLIPLVCPAGWRAFAEAWQARRRRRARPAA